MEDNKIPAFTVTKNGSILKNIFLLTKQSVLNKSPHNQESDEDILLVGRHPQCHITLEHPSISRYHLRIHSNPCLLTLSLVDLSSVHGTWVSGNRIEPGVHVVLKEGDTVKLGGSSRVYELHWVPRSQAYDVDQRCVPAVYAIKGGGEEGMNQDEGREECSSNDDLECSDLSTSDTIDDSPLEKLNVVTSGNENDDMFATVSIQDPLVVSETTSATQIADGLNDSEDQLMTNCSKSSCDDTKVEQTSPWKHEEYSSNGDLECSRVSSSNTIHDSPLKTLNALTFGNENDDIFATASIQAPLVVSETTSAKPVSDSLIDSEDQLMPNGSKSFCDDSKLEQSRSWKHEEYSSSGDLECSDLSSNTIHGSPLKTLNPLTSGNENDDIFATVSIQAPLVVSETTYATQVSDSLNDSDDQLMMNCSKSSCDDTNVEESSPWKLEEYSLVDDLECSDLSTSNTIYDSPLKTLNPLTSCNENNDIFATVSIQAPLVVSETTSATQVSDSLNDSEDQLMLNCSKSSCDDTEVEQSSPWKHEEYPLVDDLECSDLATSNTIHYSPLKTLNPLTSCNENNDIFATVSIQASPVVSETTSATQVCDSLYDLEDKLTINCSKSSCDDVKVEQSSPWKNGNGNGELFTTVCVHALHTASKDKDISETEMSDCLNKSEDKLNCLTDNLSNDIGQISHGTIKDDLVSIDLYNAIETHEKDALYQNIAKSNETDIDNENQQKINNGSDEIRDLGCEFEQMYQTKMMDESASAVLYDDVDTSVESESVDRQRMKKESTFMFLPDVADIDEDKTHTPDILKAQEIHTNSMSAQKLSASMRLFESLDGKEMEFYTPDKENKNPNACSGRSLSKKPVNPIGYEQKVILGFSQNLFATDQGLYGEQEVDPFVNCEEVLAISSEKESKSIQMIMEGSCNSMNYPRTVQKGVNSSQILARRRWTMVVDTSSLLDHKSLKHLKLLKGIKGTQLFVTKTVVRELMDIKSQDSFFKRSSKKASIALKWIDECMMNTRWWIHMDDDETVHQSSAVVRELMDVKSQDNFFKRSSKQASLALKWIDECMVNTRGWIHMDDETVHHSSTVVPEVLEIALHLREENSDQKIIILSDNLTLKIKAMAEGILCEAAEEFHKSLVNPFSERFMWVGSSARGLTWSCVDDDDIVRQKYHGFGLNGSHKFKGLKLLAHVTTSQLQLVC